LSDKPAVGGVGTGPQTPLLPRCIRCETWAPAPPAMREAPASKRCRTA